MPRLEGGLHGLKADPSARADDQDCRHGVMLPVGSAWLTVMCDFRQPHRKIGGIRRFRLGYVAAFGALAPDDVLYHAVSEGRGALAAAVPRRSSVAVMYESSVRCLR